MGRNKQIDGLRGLTILIIVVFHVFCRYQEIYNGKTIWWMKWWGSYGNTVFLLVSSYFLAGYNHSPDFSLKNFYLHKFMRLWPCYAVSITITSVAVHFFELPQRMSSWKDYALNLLWLNGFVDKPYVDGAHWYITTLVAFVIITGVIYKINVKYRIYIYAGVMLLEGLTKIFSCTILNHLVGSSWVAMLCIGISLKHMEDESYNLKNFLKIEKPKEYIKRNQWMVLFMTAMCYHLLRKGILAFIYVFVAISIFELAKNRKCILLEIKPFLFFGKISYPVYLIH